MKMSRISRLSLTRFELYESIRTVRLASTNKSLVYGNIKRKTENLSKWFGVHSWEHFAANARSFQVMAYIVNDSVTLAEEAQFI